MSSGVYFTIVKLVAGVVLKNWFGKKETEKYLMAKQLLSLYNYL